MISLKVQRRSKCLILLFWWTCKLGQDKNNLQKPEKSKIAISPIIFHFCLKSHKICEFQWPKAPGIFYILDLNCLKHFFVLFLCSKMWQTDLNMVKSGKVNGSIFAEHTNLLRHSSSITCKEPQYAQSSVKTRIFPTSTNPRAMMFQHPHLISVLGRWERTYLVASKVAVLQIHFLANNQRESWAFSNNAQFPSICSNHCWQLCIFGLESFQLFLGSLPTSLIQYFSFWHFCYFSNCYALKWETARKQLDTKMKHSQNSGTLGSLLKVMKEERIANDSSAE